MFSFFRILESAKDVVRLLLASTAIHAVTHGGSPAPQAQISRYMVSSPPGARDRPATATSSRRKFVLDSVIPFYDDASTGPSRDPSSPRHTRTSPICIHVRPIRAPTATRGLACVALPQCVSRDAFLDTRPGARSCLARQPRAACLARFRTGSSLEAERRPDGNDTARERGSVGSTGAPCPARVAPEWVGGAGETTSGAEQIGIRPKHRHIDISYTTYASQYTKSHRPSRTHRHGTARAPPFPLCNPRVAPVTRKDSVTALAYYPTLSPSQRPRQLHQPQRPHSTPLTCPPRRHGHLNP